MHNKLFDLLNLREASRQFLVIVLKLNEISVAWVFNNVVVSENREGLRDILGLLLRQGVFEH